jgi:glycerophosphoryl diester phosphodiesterase
VTKTDNPWLGRRVLCYAHQGGAREAPSSTLCAFRQAVAAGADALEMDVHATADGHLVVCHDSTVDRTTNGTGAISTLTLDQVRALDNAYWWVPGEVVAPDRPLEEYVLRGRAPDDRELGIATLREVLEAFPDVFLNLDIKQTAPAVPAYEEKVVDLLREFGRADDVIVASFNDLSTAEVARLYPELSTSPGTFGVGQFVAALNTGQAPDPGRHQALQVPTHFGPTVIIDERFLTAAHGAGVAVHAWTIDDPAEMGRLVELGVDGVMSDRPAVLAGVLSAAGATYRPG